MVVGCDEMSARHAVIILSYTVMYMYRSQHLDNSSIQQCNMLSNVYVIIKSHISSFELCVCMCLCVCVGREVIFHRLCIYMCILCNLLTEAGYCFFVQKDPPLDTCTCMMDCPPYTFLIVWQGSTLTLVH